MFRKTIILIILVFFLCPSVSKAEEQEAENPEPKVMLLFPIPGRQIPWDRMDVHAAGLGIADFFTSLELDKFISALKLRDVGIERIEMCVRVSIESGRIIQLLLSTEADASIKVVLVPKKIRP